MFNDIYGCPFDDKTAILTEVDLESSVTYEYQCYKIEILAAPKITTLSNAE